MLIHIIQAVLLAVLLMFPFRTDISNYVQSYQMKNACAAVDSSIIKYYSHKSVLPDIVDANFLEDMGLETNIADNMTYERLEERKFSLSYEDPSSKEVRYSIHSNVLLPESMDSNFAEIKEKYYPVEIEPSDHQTVSIVITYPDGSIITLQEGQKFEVPAKSIFKVSVVPDEGWTAGIPNVDEGKVVKDLVITVSAAVVKNYTLKVEDCKNQTVRIKVEDIHNSNTFEMQQNQSAKVGYETKFSLIEVVPDEGYSAGNVSPSSGIVKSDTLIKVEDAKTLTQPYTELLIHPSTAYGGSAGDGAHSLHNRIGTFTVPEGVTRLRIALCSGGRSSSTNGVRGDWYSSFFGEFDSEKNAMNHCRGCEASFVFKDYNTSDAPFIKDIYGGTSRSGPGGFGCPYRYRDGKAGYYTTYMDVTPGQEIPYRAGRGGNKAGPGFILIAYGGDVEPSTDVPSGEYVADSDYGYFEFTVPEKIDRLMAIYADGWGWLVADKGSDGIYGYWHNGDNAPFLPEDNRYRYVIVGVTPGKTYDMKVYQEDYTPYPPKLRWSAEINKMPIDFMRP